MSVAFSLHVKKDEGKCRYREIKNVDERIRQVYYTKEKCYWERHESSD